MSRRLFAALVAAGLLVSTLSLGAGADRSVGLGHLDRVLVAGVWAGGRRGEGLLGAPFTARQAAARTERSGC